LLRRRPCAFCTVTFARELIAKRYSPSCQYKYDNSTIASHVAQYSVIGDQCKTSQFKTQCKGNISHAFETAKITVFYPTVCKTRNVPLQNELLCWTHNLGYIYFMQTFIPLRMTHNFGLHYSNYVSSTFKVGQGEWPVILGQRWQMSNYE